MAHEIVNEQIAYANEVPWHGIGARMQPDQSPEEFLEAAGLNWEVNPYPVYNQIDGEFVEVPGRVTMRRSTDNKVMTHCSSSWHPVQNAEAVGFMTRYVNAGGAKMETVGALRDGQIVWGLARLEHGFEVRPGDRVNGYLLITSPHIVGKATQIRTTTVRVVCNNTMQAAMTKNGWNQGDVHYSQSHRQEFNVEDAREAVAAAIEELGEAERRAKIIDQLKLTVEDAVKKVIIPTFAPQMIGTEAMDLKLEEMPKAIQQVLESMEQGPGAIPDTGWGVLNGVTHYCDHVGGRSPSTRMFRSWMGDYSQKKLKAERLLLELADAA